MSQAERVILITEMEVLDGHFDEFRKCVNNLYALIDDIAPTTARTFEWSYVKEGGVVHVLELYIPLRIIVEHAPTYSQLVKKLFRVRDPLGVWLCGMIPARHVKAFEARGVKVCSTERTPGSSLSEKCVLGRSLGRSR